MSDDLSTRARQGHYPPFATEALALMQQRHTDLQHREAAFTKRLMDDERKAGAEIDRASEE